MKPFTMQEFSDAINRHKRGKAADTRGVNAVMIKYSNRRLKHTLTTTVQQRPSNSHKQPLPNGRSKVIHMSGTHHHHGTTDPTVRSPSCTNSLASSSSSVYNPHQTPTSPLTKQPSDRAAPRQATCSRSSNSDREPLSGTSRSGSQPSTMRDDLTTGTTAHGLFQHFTKPKFISNTTSKPRKVIQ